MLGLVCIVEFVHQLMLTLQACEVWRKEAEEWQRKAKKVDEEQRIAIRQRDEVSLIYFCFSCFEY